MWNQTQVQVMATPGQSSLQAPGRTVPAPRQSMVGGMPGMPPGGMMMPLYEDRPCTMGSSIYCFLTFLCFAALVAILGIGIEHDIVRDDIFQRMDHNQEITKNSVELQRLIIWDGADDKQLEQLLVYHKEMYRLAIASAFTRNQKMKTILQYQMQQAQKSGNMEEYDRLSRDLALYENRLTDTPTHAPSTSPTSFPSESPSSSPTSSRPTSSPTVSPTVFPTTSPTRGPSAYPTFFPTRSPTRPPSNTATESPVCAPCPPCTNAPTAPPTSPPTSPPSPTTQPPTPPAPAGSDPSPPPPPPADPSPPPSPSPPPPEPTTSPSNAVVTSSPSVSPSVTGGAGRQADVLQAPPQPPPSPLTPPVPATNAPVRRQVDDDLVLAPAYVVSAKDFDYSTFHNTNTNGGNINNTLAIVGCVNRRVRLSGGDVCRRLDADEMLWFIGRVRTFRYVLWALAFFGFLMWCSIVYMVANPPDPNMQMAESMQRSCCVLKVERGSDREKAMTSAMQEQRGFPNPSNYRYWGQMFSSMNMGMGMGMGMQPGAGFQAPPRRKGSNLRVVLHYGWACASTAAFPFIVREMFYFWEVIDWYKANTAGSLQTFWQDFNDRSLGCNLWLIIFVCWPMWWFIMKIALSPFAYALSMCSGMNMQEGQMPASNQAQDDPAERGKGGSSEMLANIYMYPWDLMRFGFMDYRLWDFATVENTILKQDQMWNEQHQHPRAPTPKEEAREEEEEMKPEPHYSSLMYKTNFGLTRELWDTLPIESKRHLESLKNAVEEETDSLESIARFLMGDTAVTGCRIPPSVMHACRSARQPATLGTGGSGGQLGSMRPLGGEMPPAPPKPLAGSSRALLRGDDTPIRDMSDQPRRASSNPKQEATTDSEAEGAKPSKSSRRTPLKKSKSKRASGKDRSDAESDTAGDEPKKKSTRVKRAKSSSKRGAAAEDTDGGSDKEARPKTRRTKAKSKDDKDGAPTRKKSSSKRKAAADSGGEKGD
eukprot:Hpha_TRINITY_DN12236_c0_g1::TRINITY_DN12236_c0_g1_i1::g.16661::m.16661